LSSSASSLRVGDGGGGEAPQAEAGVLVDGIAWPEREHDLAQRERMGVVGDLGVHARELGHALQTALEDHAKGVVAQHGEVAALVGAGEQVVDDTREVVAVALLGHRVAELRGELVDAAGVAFGDALVAQARQQVVRR